MKVSVVTISVSTQETPAETATSAQTKWVIGLFFASLFIPGAFNLGFKLDPYRIFLLGAAYPTLRQILRDPTIRLTWVDVIVVLGIAWRALAVLVNNKSSGAVYAVGLMADLVLGYAIGRAFIRKPSDFRFFFKCFLLLLLAFLPFAIVEFLTLQRVLLDLFSGVLEVPRGVTTGAIRFGFMRTQLSFETFLVTGAFCVMGFANVFYIYSDKFPLNYLFALFVAFMTALAISTSSLLTMAVQLALMIYAFLFRRVPHKWPIFLYVMLFATGLYFVLDSFNIIEYVTNKVMFNQASGRSRSIHFVYAFQELMRNPFFGVGLNDWKRPWWTSAASDSFWLALFLRNGFPALILTILGYLGHCLMISLAMTRSPYEDRLRTGYVISFASAMIMFFYAVFYNSSGVFFLMFMGAGAWFYDRSEESWKLQARNRRMGRVSPASDASTPALLGRETGARPGARPSRGEKRQGAGMTAAPGPGPQAAARAGEPPATGPNGETALGADPFAPPRLRNGQSARSGPSSKTRQSFGRGEP